MASAGLIPIVGWGGRLLKGGSAIYKTAKGMNAADQALDVYKTTKTFSNLEKAELGIYGLTSANGLSEYITGKDMFGNELTDIQRQQSLYYSILGPALMAAPFVPTLIKNGKLVKDETVTQIHKLATKTKSGAHYVYNEVKGGMQVLLQNQNMNFAFAGANGVKPLLSNVMNSKEISKRIEEVVSRFSLGKSLEVNKGSEDVGEVISKGKDHIKQGDKSSLAPGGGLAAHEAKGGHLIERHVGKTDEELLERLKNNPKITGSSTFNDRMTAEKVATTVLNDQKNIDKIQKWLSDPNSRPTLPLRYKGDGEIIGRSVSRNSEEVENVTNAKIVLKKDNNGSFILTGYPVK